MKRPHTSSRSPSKKRMSGAQSPLPRYSADNFLPTTREEMNRLGWSELDFLCITGDAYVDHPSFGHAIVARFLEAMGYRVGVLAQPDWRGTVDFARMGPPRYAVLVAAGNLDSMLSNYVSPGHRRKTDAYAPGGEAGKRPDRATIVYCNRVRELWKEVPLLIGGIEASLRRLAHYDYWSDEVRRSILIDSRADLLIYGMAEYQLEKIALALREGASVREIRDIPGTCWKTHDRGDAPDALEIPSYEAAAGDRRAFAEAFVVSYREQNFASGRRIVQDQGAWLVVQNPPPPPLSTEYLDRIYDLPFTRKPHPSYENREIPALAEVKFSIVSHRGCFGECAFCAISSHQGRVIQARSPEGILREAKRLTEDEDFKGYIHDLGGPTANFRAPACAKSLTQGACADRSCLFPSPCKNLTASHEAYMSLLRQIREMPGVKKVFIRSGIRYDYMLHARDGMKFLDELCRHHVSGQLKIAPEHASEQVLKRMRKPPATVTERFIEAYRSANLRAGKKQYLVPYFMSSHPGCDLKGAFELALFIRKIGVRPEQAQEFTPTPGTAATCMYHTGIDPFTGEDIPVARTHEEKAMQRALLQFWMPQNRGMVRRALRKLGKSESTLYRP